MFRKLFLLCGLMLLVGLCAGFSFSDINVGAAIDAGTDAVKAATLSEADVQELGRQCAAEMDKENKVAPASNAYAQRLAKIVGRLQSEDDLSLNFKVYLTSDVNAFALPDGSVRVFSALMDLMTDDEVYFVIGHEIGHVKNGDTFDRFRVAYTTSAARKGAVAAGGTAGALSASDLGALGESFLHAQFSQSQESAADEYGLRMMQKYSKDTAAAVSALRKLAQLGGGEASMFSTHPDSNARADRLESLR